MRFNSGFKGLTFILSLRVSEIFWLPGVLSGNTSRQIYEPVLLLAYDTKDTELCCILLVTRKGMKTQYIIPRLCVCLLIADEISRRDVVDMLYVPWH